MNGFMHLSLLKVDEEKRLVIARAAATEPDRSGEIMDWETAKPEFIRWSNAFDQATGGLSKGNVRLQHNPKHVAGKVIDMTINDDQQAIDVVCKVVDDQAWKLCKEGCITGISIGGSYARKWKDDRTGLTKYTPRITEISLVDNPCIPSARIVELVKADGSTEMMKVTGRARSFAEIMAKAAEPEPRDFAAVLAAQPRSFAEVMAKGAVEMGGRIGEWAGRKVAAMTPAKNRAARELAEAGHYLTIRSGLPESYPANLRGYRKMRQGQKFKNSIDNVISDAGDEAVQERYDRLGAKGRRHGRNATRYGIGAAGGAGAAYLANRNREGMAKASWRDQPRSFAEVMEKVGGQDRSRWGAQRPDRSMIRVETVGYPRGKSAIPRTGTDRSMIRVETVGYPRGKSAIPRTGTDRSMIRVERAPSQAPRPAANPRSNINMEALGRARDRMAATQASLAGAAARRAKFARAGLIGGGVAALGAGAAYLANRNREGMAKADLVEPWTVRSAARRTAEAAGIGALMGGAAMAYLARKNPMRGRTRAALIGIGAAGGGAAFGGMNAGAEGVGAMARPAINGAWRAAKRKYESMKAKVEAR